MARPKSQSESSTLVRKGLPCPDPKCGSSDAVAEYSDGHFFCHSHSGLVRYGDAEKPTATRKVAPLTEALQSILDGSYPTAIKSRKLTPTTTAKWDYRTRVTPKGHKEQIAIYHDKHGRPIAAKIRDTGVDGLAKDFRWVGDAKKVGLYGRHLWGHGGNRRAGGAPSKLVITEGEIDAMSVSQVQDHKWPVVSVPNGAAEASKAIANNLEWVNSFDEVIIMFDMDGPGGEAAQEVASVLTPGKAFIATLPRKDANECLKEGLTEDLKRSIWNAKPWRPDGVIDARELTIRCMAPVVVGSPWPWKFMTDWTYGRRGGEVYVGGAGTGIGKSDWSCEVIASTLNGKTKEGLEFKPEGVAVFGYEAGAAVTKKAIAGKLAGRRFHIPQGEGPDWGDWTTEELQATMRDMDQRIWGNGGKLFINDSFGACDWDAAKERSRYLAKAEGLKHFVYDPISAMVINAEDERKALDALMIEGASLAVELDVCVYFLSHLTRPDQGPSHEEGGQVRLKQFRGSNGIGMFSSFVFGFERNTQAEDERERTKTLVRVVKDRYTGNSTGKTRVLHYDILAGTLDEETVRLELGEP